MHLLCNSVRPVFRRVWAFALVVWLGAASACAQVLDAEKFVGRLADGSLGFGVRVIRDYPAFGGLKAGDILLGGMQYKRVSGETEITHLGSPDSLLEALEKAEPGTTLKFRRYRQLDGGGFDITESSFSFRLPRRRLPIAGATPQARRTIELIYNDADAITDPLIRSIAYMSFHIAYSDTCSARHAGPMRKVQGVDTQIDGVSLPVEDHQPFLSVFILMPAIYLKNYLSQVNPDFDLVTLQVRYRPLWFDFRKAWSILFLQFGCSSELARDLRTEVREIGLELLEP